MNTFYRVLYIAGLTLLFAACNSNEPQERTEKKVVAKPKASLTLLTQGRAFEKVLGESAERGIQQGLRYIAESSKEGFGAYDVSLATVNLSQTSGTDEVRSLVSDSAVVFAVLDEDNSYLLAKITHDIATPIIFLNDGPMRTCSPLDPSRVDSTLWQAGLTDSQAVEPFLIYLAEALKDPKSAFRFSFFTTDVHRPLEVTDVVVDNVGALGFDVVEEQTLDPRITDFYKPLRRLLGVPSDMLFFSVSPEYVERLLQQTSKMLIYKDFTLATLWLLPEEQLARLGQLADRIVTVSRFEPSFVETATQNNDAVWKFEGVSQLHTAIATAAYTTMHLLQRASLKAGGIDPASLNAGLQLVTLKTPQSTVWFNRENHILLQPMYAVSVGSAAGTTRYETQKYLGDVEHPGITKCSFAYYKALEEEETQAPRVKYQ